MGGSDLRATMTEAVEQFQSELERLAVALARAVVNQHLGRGPASRDGPGPKPVPLVTPKLKPAREPKGHGREQPARPPRHDQAPAPARPPRRGRGPAPKPRDRLELEWLEAEHAERDTSQPLEPEPVSEVAAEVGQLTAAPHLPVVTEPVVTTPATPPAAASSPSARIALSASGKRGGWTRDSILSELVTSMSNGTAIDAQFVRRHGAPGLGTAARRIFGRIDAALNLALIELSKLHPEGPAKR